MNPEYSWPDEIGDIAAHQVVWYAMHNTKAPLGLAQRARDECEDLLLALEHALHFITSAHPDPAERLKVISDSRSVIAAVTGGRGIPPRENPRRRGRHPYQRHFTIDKATGLRIPRSGGRGPGPWHRAHKRKAYKRNMDAPADDPREYAARGWPSMRDNPGRPDRGEVAAAVRRFKGFHDAEPSQLTPVDIPALGPVAVPLGTALEVNYRSPKWGGKPHAYTHSFSRRNPPMVVTNPAGNVLVVYGGNLKVKPAGITG